MEVRMIYHKKRNTIYSDLSTVEKKAIMLRQHSAGEGSLRWEFGVSIPGLSSTRHRFSETQGILKKKKNYSIIKERMKLIETKKSLNS